MTIAIPHPVNTARRITLTAWLKNHANDRIDNDTANAVWKMFADRGGLLQTWIIDETVIDFFSNATMLVENTQTGERHWSRVDPEFLSAMSIDRPVRVG